MNRDQIIILKMEGHIKFIIEYAAMCGTLQSYLSNEIICSASILHLLQIGELAGDLDDSFCARHSNIQWKGIIGLRNIIAHRYGELNYTRLWDIMTCEVPQLAEWLASRPS